MAHSSKTFTPNAPADDFAHYHPALRPMRRVVEGLFERNHPAAFPLLAALATLNGKATFWAGGSYPDDESEGGRA